LEQSKVSFQQNILSFNTPDLEKFVNIQHYFEAYFKKNLDLKIPTFPINKIDEIS